MLLELLSDFQISIPELGPDRGAHAAGRAADLEQLARADRGAQAPLPVPVARLPELEHELEIVRLHAPELSETVARRLVEVVAHGARARPQEAAVDRRVDRLGARAAAARRRGHRRARFRETMSVIVKHRTDLDMVAERVGVRLGWRRADGVSLPPPGIARASARSCAREGVAVGTSELLDAFAALQRGRLDRRRPTSARRSRRRSPSRRRTGACSSWSSSASSSARPRRQARRARERRARRAAARLDGRRADRPRRAARADRRGAPRRRRGRDARPRAAGDRRLRRASGEGSGVIGVDVQRIRRALGLRAEPQPTCPTGDPRRDGAAARASARFEAAAAARARARADRAHAALPPGAAAERARPRAAVRAAAGPRRRAPRRRAAQAPPGDAGPRARAAHAATRTSTCAARCAPRCRPAACRWS